MTNLWDGLQTGPWLRLSQSQSHVGTFDILRDSALLVAFAATSKVGTDRAGTERRWRLIAFRTCCPIIPNPPAVFPLQADVVPLP